MRQAVLLVAAISLQSDQALAALLSRLDKYISEYEPRLSQVIAD